MTISRPAIVFHAITMVCPKTYVSTITKKAFAIDLLCDNVLTPDVTVPQTNRGETVLDMKSQLVYQGAVWRVQRVGLI